MLPCEEQISPVRRFVLNEEVALIFLGPLRTFSARTSHLPRVEALRVRLLTLSVRCVRFCGSLRSGGQSRRELDVAGDSQLLNETDSFAFISRPGKPGFTLSLPMG